MPRTKTATAIDESDNGVGVLDAPLRPAAKAKGAGRGKILAPGEETITIPALELSQARITLIGDTPLISHRWSEKAKKEMLDKQMKRAKQGKEAKNPWGDYLDSLYWLSERPKNIPEGDFSAIKKAAFGFPAVAFKAAAINACSHVADVTKVAARGVFHINSEYVTIDGDYPEPREDMVRVGMGTADIRYRGEFKNWTVTFEIRYNRRVMSLEQIFNLFNTAGFAIGVGEWRPQKNGQFGMFHVGNK
jgi:hypothetical protein